MGDVFKKLTDTLSIVFNINYTNQIDISSLTTLYRKGI